MTGQDRPGRAGTYLDVAGGRDIVHCQAPIHDADGVEFDVPALHVTVAVTTAAAGL